MKRLLMAVVVLATAVAADAQTVKPVTIKPNSGNTLNEYAS